MLRRRSQTLLLCWLIILAGCATTGEPPSCDLLNPLMTVPMHDPIYPGGGSVGSSSRENITYSLEVSNAPDNLDTIKLAEKVDTINQDGTVTVAGSWATLKVWPGPFSSTINLSYPGGSLITCGS